MVTSYPLGALVLVLIAVIAAVVFVRSLRLPASYQKNVEKRREMRKERLATGPVGSPGGENQERREEDEPEA